MRKHRSLKSGIYGFVIVSFVMSCIMPAGALANPTVTITSPQGGAMVKGQTQIDVSFQGEKGLPVTQILLFVDGKQVQQWALASPRTEGKQSFNWDFSLSTGESHTISARAIDAQGQVGNATIQVRMQKAETVQDTLPPVVTIFYPAHGAKVHGNISLKANASDNDGIASVFFYVDGKFKSMIMNAPPYQTDLDTSKLSDGPHVLSATAFDRSDNQGKSAEVTIFVVNRALTTGEGPDLTAIDPPPSLIGDPNLPQVSVPTAAAPAPAPVTPPQVAVTPPPSILTPLVQAQTGAFLAGLSVASLAAAALPEAGGAIDLTARTGRPTGTVVMPRPVAPRYVPAPRVAPITPPPTLIAPPTVVALTPANPPTLGAAESAGAQALTAMPVTVPPVEPDVRMGAPTRVRPVAPTPTPRVATIQPAMPVALAPGVPGLAASGQGVGMLPSPAGAAALTLAPTRTGEPGGAPAVAVAPLPSTIAAAVAVQVGAAGGESGAELMVGTASRATLGLSGQRMGRLEGRAPVEVAVAPAAPTLAPLTSAVLTYTPAQEMTARTRAELLLSGARTATPEARAVAMLPQKPAPVEGTAAAPAPSPEPAAIAKIRDVRIVFNGEPLDLRSLPETIRGISMAPLREIFEKTDGKVYWFAVEKRVHAVNPQVDLNLTIGNRVIQVNDEPRTLSLAPYLKNGRTMVPLQFLADALNVTISYNQDSGQIRISSNEF